MTASLADAIKEARAAAARLREQHYQWIVEAALRAFEEAIAKEEIEIVRHEQFEGESVWSRFDGSRAERLQHLREVLAQRRDILVFLRAASRVLMTASIEAFAQELRASGFWDRRPS